MVITARSTRLNRTTVQHRDSARLPQELKSEGLGPLSSSDSGWGKMLNGAYISSKDPGHFGSE